MTYILCPSSGDFHCTHSNGICHISSVHCQEFFTVHTAMVYVIWHIYSVHRQEIFTVHTAMVYVIYPLSIVRSFSLYTQEWCMSYGIYPLSIVRSFSLYIHQWYMSYDIYHGCFSCECCVLLLCRGLYDGLITRPEGPTERGASECDHESSTMRRPWPTGAVAPW